MPHQKKYQEGTTNRTMTFFKKDLDILQSHTGYRMTLTDLVQQAIKEFIKRNGLDPDQTGNQGEEPTQANPNLIDEIRSYHYHPDPTIPDPTKPALPCLPTRSWRR